MFTNSNNVVSMETNKAAIDKSTALGYAKKKAPMRPIVPGGAADIIHGGGSIMMRGILFSVGMGRWVEMKHTAGL